MQWFVVFTSSCKNLTPLTTVVLSTFSSAFNTFEWHQRIKKLCHHSPPSTARLFFFVCDRLQPLVFLPPSFFSTCVSTHLSLVFLIALLLFLSSSFCLHISYSCIVALPLDSVSTSLCCILFSHLAISFSPSVPLCFPISLPTSQLAV